MNAATFAGRITELLDDALSEPEVDDTLVRTGLARDHIEAAVGERTADVLAGVDLWVKAAEEATARLAAAEAKLAAYRPPLWTKLVQGLGWLLVLGLAGCVVLAFVESPWWLYPLLFFGLPWALISAPGWRRGKRGRELRVPALTRQRDQADERLDAALRLQVVTTVREAINAELQCYDTAFRVFDDRGLEQLADRDREIPIGTTERLQLLMASLASGSIGLSGSRGAGKTALIHSFARGVATVPRPKTRRGLVVSAPVRYDPREFLLHLFAKLCEEALGEKGLEEMRWRRESEASARRSRLLTVLVAGGGTLLALAGALMLWLKKTAPEGATETGTLYLGIGMTLVYVAALMWFSARARRRQARSYTPERRAEDNLEEISYQQSVASGWTGGFKLPLGMSLGADSKRTMARTPMTFPEVVDRFKKYAESLTEEHYWVIGIDELDKMRNEEEARRFLNDIKGIFDVPGCYYLISVSEDAMSSFERRGLPFRDEFDSSFDAIVRMGYLSFAEAQDVLERRVVGLPVPFHALSHCIAGGLPRDLIRAARELIQQDRRLTEARRHEPPRASSLGELCRAVVGVELEAKVAAALVAARAALPAIDREWLLTWLREEEASSATADSLRERCRRLAAWPGLLPPADGHDGIVPGARQIALELAAYSYYAATLLEFFTDDLDEARCRSVVDGEQPVIERLARARQDFSTSCFLAWRSTSRFRREVEGLHPWDAPLEDPLMAGAPVT
jgi:hypothetical protein